MKPFILAQKIIFISLCTLLCFYVIFSKRGVREYLRKQHEIEQEKLAVVDIEKTIENLKTKIQAWKKEDFEHERMARQDLNMGYTNELVYKVPPTKNPVA